MYNIIYVIYRVVSLLLYILIKCVRWVLWCFCAPKRPPKRKGVAPKLRMELWHVHFKSHSPKGVCYCCPEVLQQKNGDPPWEAGHVDSVSSGGLDKLHNLRPLCRTCNRRMGTRNLYVWTLMNPDRCKGSRAWNNAKQYFIDQANGAGSGSSLTSTSESTTSWLTSSLTTITSAL